MAKRSDFTKGHAGFFLLLTLHYERLSGIRSMKVFSYKRNRFLGYALVGLIFLLFLFAEIINGRLWLSDFEVYYKAAVRLLSAQNLYRIEADGFYIFKYSPVSAAFFIPFAFFPFGAAKILYWIFYSGIMLACIHEAKRLAWQPGENENGSRINTLVLITGLIFMVHFLRELHLGQVTFILLLLYLLALRTLLSGSDWLSGLLLAVSIFIKPFGLIFLPYLMIKGKWKALMWVLIFSITLIFLPLIFYGSFGFLVEQYSAWYREVIIELGNKQDLAMAANQTIFSVLARYSGIAGMLGSPVLINTYRILVLALLTGLVLLLVLKGKGMPNREIPESFFLMGLIPLLAFSGENSFCLFLPSSILVIICFKELTLLLKITAILSFLFIGGNIYDLWGPVLSAWFDQISLITLGAVGLSGITAFLRIKKVF